jgi:hypothetical protein
MASKYYAVILSWLQTVSPFGALCGATVAQHGNTIDLLDRRFEQSAG